MKDITLLAINLAKDVYQLHGVNEHGKAMLTRKLSRKKLVPFIAQLKPCKIVMEACGSSNYWGRTFQSLGHEVMLISPQHVKPFVRGNKNDANDAKGISIAATQDNMPSVPIKTLSQQDIQVIHRRRELLVTRRTATSNQMRGLLIEYGEFIPRGKKPLLEKVPLILEDAENELTAVAREEVALLRKEYMALDEEVAKYDVKIDTICKENAICQKFMELPGIGPKSASILFVSLGCPSHFKNGRHFAAYLGLVPREHSSGGKHQLLSISKRGDVYIRSLLVHGGRTVIQHVDKKEDPFSRWAKRIKHEKGYNKASVAVANKNARHVWAIMTKGDSYINCYKEAA